MARITIEDCIEKVPNRFELVQMVSIRAKQLQKGARALVDSDENKTVVVALREIAAGLVSPDYSGQADSSEQKAARNMSAAEAVFADETGADAAASPDAGASADKTAAPEPAAAAKE